MPANISIVNGVAEAAFALVPAWHNLGTVLSEVPNSETMAKECHGDFEVAIEPIQTVTGGTTDEYFATVRKDTNKILGIVSDRYKVIQNKDVFKFLDGLLMDGMMKYESAGCLKGGKIFWALARMPSVDEIAEGDTSKRYIMFSNSHDTTEEIHIVPTSIRVVCENTYRLAVGKDNGIRHLGNMDEKLEQVKLLISQYDEKFTLFRDNARQLATKYFTDEQKAEYIEILFPSVEKIGRGKTMRDGKVNSILQAVENERNSLPSIKGTWWSLYNGVSEVVDHQTSFKGNPLERAENRMLSLTDGRHAELKNKAFQVALEMAV